MHFCCCCIFLLLLGCGMVPIFEKRPRAVALRRSTVDGYRPRTNSSSCCCRGTISIALKRDLGEGDALCVSPACVFVTCVYVGVFACVRVFFAIPSSFGR